MPRSSRTHPSRPGSPAGLPGALCRNPLGVAQSGTSGLRAGEARGGSSDANTARQALNPAGRPAIDCVES
eukprot:4673873-Lingulodinium_polyedra.AAC.1